MSHALQSRQPIPLVDPTTARQWIATKARITALEAELSLLRSSLIACLLPEWERISELKPTPSVSAEGVRLTMALRAKILPAIPDQALPCFQPTYEIRVDGNMIHRRQRDTLLGQIRDLVSEEALTVTQGYKPRPNAYNLATEIGPATAKFVLEEAGYTPTLCIEKNHSHESKTLQTPNP